MMKGKVLGFDGVKGAITGDDDNRYSFDGTEWKSEKAPQAGDEVDFIAVEGVATEIYKTVNSFNTPTLENLGASLENASASVSGAVANIDTGKLDYLRTRPQLILMALAIFAFFFLNFVTFGASGLSAFALPGGLDEVAVTLGFFGAGDGFGLAASFAYILWLIPVLGGFGIYRIITEKRSKSAELGTAATCLSSILVYSVILAALKSFNVGTLITFDDMISFGFGGWLIILSGIGLTLTALGIIKAVPGWPEPKQPSAE